MNRIIAIKGNNNGLRLVVNARADFEQIKSALNDKLSTSAKFFMQNTIITLENSPFSSQEHNILSELLKKYHLILQIAPKRQRILPANEIESKPAELPAKIIKRTIRGGEEIIYKGSIVIYGNVNPGSKIVAGGNIDVHGHCRGVVHAGAFGNHDAYIVADRLAPLQIRIASFIARSPDNDDDSSVSTEKAFIKDGNIILEPFER